MKGNERARFRGFTLIELAVVITIISLVALLIFPRLGSLGLGSLRTEARRIQSQIQFLFNLSVLEKGDYRMVFDLDEQCYWAEKRQGAEYTQSNLGLLSKYCLPSALVISELEALGRKSAQYGAEYIYFSPFGYVEEARIYLTNSSGEGFSLFTEPITGQVNVYPGHYGFKDLER